MTARPRPLGLLVAGVVLTAPIAGCAGAQSSGTQQSGTQRSVAAGNATSAASSMSMSPGTSMQGVAMPGAATVSKPTATALMVCSDDIKGKVKQVLALPGLPQTTSAFAGAIYTCTYHLPQGLLVLSVQHSGTPAAAHAYYASVRSSLGTTEPLIGLGDEAFAAPTGVAVVKKDNETLVVDARGLPVVFGSNQQKRTDLADEVASDVLGCWTGSE